ncbi:4Fe-4S binding protein [Sedimentibacter sp. zth1]|uniref:ATP-binding protein n=1 Tax=Sedimentibacter sp. zth1 TaxID=2816908 RepID=UPI001A92C16F|nr:4Fe-4S binding protein [Sedimentibacter sp. zth1]QSX05770.1 4Fe-4S binding protein [Sedimentibacter sp. zth1]
MIRKIIQINEDKCNGCGLCATACHEGAIGIINNKAKLLRDDYCDGLGDCIPNCPTGAITFIEREALAYDEASVLENQKKNQVVKQPCGCPGSKAKGMNRKEATTSQLSQWPVQIKLVPISAPYFNECDLLIAADCTAYAYANFHNDFIKNKITLIACPKLDNINYAEKLSTIFSSNNINSVTVVRMEVPCCGGLEVATKNAIISSEKSIPCKIVTIKSDGTIK